MRKVATPTSSSSSITPSSSSLSDSIIKKILLSYSYVAIWIFLSFSVIIYNKYILDPKLYNWSYPISLTMIHMLFCSTLAFILVHVFKIVELPASMSLDMFTKSVIPIGLLYSMSLWFSNSAYIYLSVSFIQMLKALMPVAVYSIGIMLNKESFKSNVMSNMIGISFGVAIAAYGEARFDTFGVLLQLGAVGFEATRLVLIQILLTSKGITLNPITSLYYIAPCCLVFLFVPWIFVEMPRLREASSFQFDVFIFGTNSLCAFALNLAVFLLVGKTSALTMNIAGVVKDWLLIAFSWSVIKDHVTGINLFGYGIAFLGVGYYNHTKLQAMKANEAQKNATKADEETGRLEIACLSRDNGGLGIRNLQALNKAALIKTCWEAMNTDSWWSGYCKDKFQISINHLKAGIHDSSIWHGIHSVYNHFNANIRWAKGQDNDCCSPYDDDDSIIWENSHDGSLKFKDAYNSVNPIGPNKPAPNYIWNNFTPPKFSTLVWRLIHKKLPTDDNIAKRGIQITSACLMCDKIQCEETAWHVIFCCDFAKSIWAWVFNMFKTQIPSSINERDWWDYISDLNFSPKIRKIWIATCASSCFYIWKARNRLRFEDEKPNLHRTKSHIRMLVKMTVPLCLGPCNEGDENILSNLKIKYTKSKSMNIINVFWHPPICNWIKINTDGLSKGNPGEAICGGVFRDSGCNVRGAFYKYLGFQSSQHAEIMGFMIAVNHSWKMKWDVWLETDATCVINLVNSKSIPPWRIKYEWLDCMEKLKSLNYRVTHIYREGNKAADYITNMGVGRCEERWWNKAPDDEALGQILNKEKLGFPNFRRS